MSGHTAGPWEFDGEYVWADSVKGYVADPNMEDVPNAEEREANGRLIAAAPEMLETLEAIRNAEWRDWEELASPEEFVRWAKSRANHAIAKATGGAE